MISPVYCGLGITPACAGKRLPEERTARMPGDHPRVREEETETANVSFLLRGSPPRARGRGLLLVVEVGGVGITPACAGKRSSSGVVGCLPGDHPRVRGEE